jgi:hypothetical protein
MVAVVKRIAEEADYEPIGIGAEGAGEQED